MAVNQPPLTFRIDGLRELLRVTDQLPKDVKREIRKELRDVAVPVRDEATSLFLTQISPHSRYTRYGISLRKVGTLTVEQRMRRTANPRRRRPNLVNLQLDRALLPSLAHNEPRIMAGFDRVLDSLERRWRLP